MGFSRFTKTSLGIRKTRNNIVIFHLRNFPNICNVSLNTPKYTYGYKCIRVKGLLVQNIYNLLHHFCMRNYKDYVEYEIGNN